MLADIGLEIDRVTAALDGMYSAAVINNILERELASLRKIRDNYEKIVIALECDLTQTQDGIKIIKALDFLLE